MVLGRANRSSKGACQKLTIYSGGLLQIISIPKCCWDKCCWPALQFCSGAATILVDISNIAWLVTRDWILSIWHSINSNYRHKGLISTFNKKLRTDNFLLSFQLVTFHLNDLNFLLGLHIKLKMITFWNLETVHYPRINNNNFMCKKWRIRIRCK